MTRNKQKNPKSKTVFSRDRTNKRLDIAGKKVQ